MSNSAMPYGSSSAHHLPSYVRPARPSDAEAIGIIQAQTMHTLLCALLNRPLSPEAESSLSAEQFGAQWEHTIRSHAPRSAVYIAYDAQYDHSACSQAAHTEEFVHGRDNALHNGIVGFAAGISSESDDGTVFVVTAYGVAQTEHAESSDLSKSPKQTREHGARLLAALADTARKTGARALYTWLFAGDDAAIALFSEAGFAPAGAIQTLDIDGTELTQHLWWSEL